MADTIYNLDPIEIRVLGALVEKELATPEYYPLTLNSLTAACNQKSNRDPVMELADTEVVQALDSLRRQGLAMQSAESARVPKYRHTLSEKLYLEPEELAVLAELLLRGPQTVGELRTRASRMRPFDDLAAVEETLQSLAEHEPSLAVRLPRQPGRKEQRFGHLLSGEPDLAAEAEGTAPPEAARQKVTAQEERIASLETEVATLKQELSKLRELLEEFRAQFE